MELRIATATNARRRRPSDRLAADDVTERKPAERYAGHVRDEQARRDKGQEARAVERVEMPLVIHAVGHLVTRVAGAQEQPQEPGPPEQRLRSVDERLVRH